MKHGHRRGDIAAVDTMQPILQEDIMRSFFDLRPHRRGLFSVALLALAMLIAAPLSADSLTEANAERGIDANADASIFEAPIHIESLEAPVWVSTDVEGRPHIYALNERDAQRVLGYLHARDRLFQMDFYRRSLEGTLAELLGEPALAGDMALRPLDFAGFSQKSFDALPPAGQAWLEAYADGVNAWLESHALPDEYAELEISTTRPWAPWDGMTFWLGVSFDTWGDGAQLARTQILDAYQQAGAAGGFDGSRLYFEDIFRVAPIVEAPTVPDFLDGVARVAPGKAQRTPAKAALQAGVAEAASAVLESSPTAAAVAKGLVSERLSGLGQGPIAGMAEGWGSNWWAVSGEHTRSGAALLANDPHQPLQAPVFLYDVHITVTGRNPVDVHGVTFFGLPGPQIGCNAHACWGATNNRVDVADVFAESLILDPITGQPTHSIYQGQAEPLLSKSFSYRVNQLGDGIDDNLVPAPTGNAGYYLPRRDGGPLLGFQPTGATTAAGFSVQYTGFSPIFDFEGFRRLQRVSSAQEFGEIAQLLDAFILNLSYADTDGNIAYFTTGEIPLREDLEAGFVDGPAPYFVRDGTGQLQHEWLDVETPLPNQSVPRAILPYDELPSSINPERGFLPSANADPIGVTFDNDPLNEMRPNGSLFYYQWYYPSSLRAGRITELLERRLADDRPVNARFTRRMQADGHQNDARHLLPHLLQAHANGVAHGADPQLAALAADPAVVEAIGRLKAWRGSTPTGLQAGYDPGDDPDHLQAPGGREAAESVATTLFNVWRSRAIHNVIDATLDRVGLGAAALGATPGSFESHSALVHRLRGFSLDQGGDQGYGASGVDFFAVPGATSREAARDIVLLTSLRETLDLLAGDAFADAFGHSSDQDDYRWGRLHRLYLQHPLGGGRNIPEAGGFSNLAPELPGLSRHGGFETLDVGGFPGLRAEDDQAYVYSLTAGRRFFGFLHPGGLVGRQIIPGGQSGDALSPFYTNQHGRYLTNRYTRTLVHPADVALHSIGLQIYLP